MPQTLFLSNHSSPIRNELHLISNPCMYLSSSVTFYAKYLFMGLSAQLDCKLLLMPWGLAQSWQLVDALDTPVQLGRLAFRLPLQVDWVLYHSHYTERAPPLKSQGVYIDIEDRFLVLATSFCIFGAIIVLILPIIKGLSS